jgi:hypothetical protein
MWKPGLLYMRIYMRKPGLESAPPENQGDWERLLSRWLRNRHEDMLDALRAIVEGRAGGDPRGPHGIGSPKCIRTRGTRTLGSPYRPSSKRCTGARCPLGRYEFDYALLGNFAQPSLADLLDMLRQAVVRHTGRSEFLGPNPARDRTQADRRAN